MFERWDRVVRQATADAARIKELYAEIGHLTAQMCWLKKSGLAPVSGVSGYDQARPS